MGETPGTDDSGAENASFYDDQEVRQGIAAFLLAATVPFLLLFAAALAGLATAADRAWAEIWRRMLLGGSFILGAIIMVMAMIHFALADGADNVDPAALQALNLLDGNFWVAANPALGRPGNYNRLGWVALPSASGSSSRSSTSSRCSSRCSGSSSPASCSIERRTTTRAEPGRRSPGGTVRWELREAGVLSSPQLNTVCMRSRHPP